MNLCKDIDYYISLYIDNELTEEEKELFLDHVKICEECAQKLTLAVAVGDYFNQCDDIELPPDFSSSLHKKLININEPAEKNIFIRHKRWIAALSTAAVLVISLFAYNLIPTVKMGRNMTGSVSGSIQQQTQSNSVPPENGYIPESDAGDSKAASENAEKSTAAIPDSQNKTAKEDSNAGAAKDTNIPKVKSENKISEKSGNGNPTLNDDSLNESKKVVGKDGLLFRMQISDKTDNKQEYYSNSAELNLKVSDDNTEIDNLKKLMNEIGAKEVAQADLKSSALTNEEAGKDEAAGGGADKNDSTGSEEDKNAEKDSEDENQSGPQTFAAALKSAPSPAFIEYVVPILQYKSIVDGAKKYGLNLIIKTDMVKNDITDKFNKLNTQKEEIDKKIDETESKGEDSSLLQSQKSKLMEQINDIINKNDMITVKIYFSK